MKTTAIKTGTIIAAITAAFIIALTPIKAKADDRDSVIVDKKNTSAAINDYDVFENHAEDGSFLPAALLPCPDDNCVIFEENKNTLDKIIDDINRDLKELDKNIDDIGIIAENLLQ